MGGKNKGSKKNANANKSATKSEDVLDHDDVEQLDAANADAPADSDDAGADGDASGAANDDKPAKVKTWLDAQVERMRRAVQHNNLTAMVVRANHEIAKLDAKEADKIAKQIEHHTKAAKDLIEDFLGKIPEKHEGITPTKTGDRQPARNLLAGVKVTIKPEAVKNFAALFSAEELADLTVVGAAGKMVRLATPSKASLTIEAKNVIPVVAAA